MQWDLYIVTSENRIASGDFGRFISKVGRTVGMRLIVGCRGFNPDVLPRTIPIEVLALPLNLGISEARNSIMAAFPPREDAAIAFPDDDCWYSEGLLERVASQLIAFDFVLGVVDTQGTENVPTDSPSQIVDCEVLLKRTASAAMFFSPALPSFKFDTRLGLGAQVGSAEDLDVVMTLYLDGYRGIFDENVRVGHPARDRRNDYFAGSVAVLTKHRRSELQLVYPLIRRLIHGIVMMLKREISVRTFVFALRTVGMRWHV